MKTARVVISPLIVGLMNLLPYLLAILVVVVLGHEVKKEIGSNMVEEPRGEVVLF